MQPKNQVWDKWENGDANRPNTMPWKEAIKIKGVVSKQMKHTLSNFFVRHLGKVMEEQALETLEKALLWAEEDRKRQGKSVCQAIKFEAIKL